MSANVVCISRSLGAGGEEVARLVATGLGFRYVDDEIIMRAADHAGVTPGEVEQAEHARPLLTRVMEALAAAPMGAEGGSAMLAPVQPPANYEGLIERVIRDIGKEGNAVIVAHGASHPLAGAERVLRALITASPKNRAAHLAMAQNLAPDAALKAVEKSDRERQQFLKRFYDVEHELPTHYDVTVNTDALTPQQAADVLVQLARA